jgi:uncharacterized membrane protein YoaK (UPF0700 family)
VTKSFLLFVIYALCTYRLSTLIVVDELTNPMRLRVITWATKHKHPMVSKWINCVWCVSIWIGGGVVLLARFAGSWAVWPCAALAFSAVAGFLSERE